MNGIAVRVYMRCSNNVMSLLLTRPRKVPPRSFPRNEMQECFAAIFRCSIVALVSSTPQKDGLPAPSERAFFSPVQRERPANREDASLAPPPA
jgi:hypothetical protein